MRNELMCTVPNGMGNLLSNSSFEFKLHGWPAAVALVGCAVCFTVVRWIDTQNVVQNNFDDVNNS